MKDEQAVELVKYVKYISYILIFIAGIITALLI